MQEISLNLEELIVRSWNESHLSNGICKNMMNGKLGNSSVQCSWKSLDTSDIFYG